MKQLLTRTVCYVLIILILMLCTASATNINFAPILEGNDKAEDTSSGNDTQAPSDDTSYNSSTDETESSVNIPEETESSTETEETTETVPDTESTAETKTSEETEIPTEAPAETEEPTEAPTESPDETQAPDGTEYPSQTEAETEAYLTFDPVKAELPPLKKNERIDPAKPMIALTFDDGPTAHTDRLLDYFKKYGGKGTFFVVGNHLDYNPDTVRRIVDEGHDIGGHSWDHKEMIWLSSWEMMDQINMTRSKIKEITGKDTYLMRLPYGSFNDEVKRVGAGVGVAFVNWSVDTLDWKLKNADAVYNKIISSAYDGAVILCHDLHKTTVDAMEIVIPKLIEDGYQLVTFTELMSFATERLESGSIYYRR